MCKVKIRQGDVEDLSRHLDRKKVPRKGRLVELPDGRRIHFDTTERGGVRFRHVDGEEDS